MSLQYGVPLVTLVDKFRHARFEPAGMTSNRDIPFAKSIIDYIFCWLGCQFIPGYAERNTPNRTATAPVTNKNTTTAKKLVEKTKDLADKIAEVKAEQEITKKPAQKPVRTAISEQFIATDRISSLVPAGISDSNDDAKAESSLMQQFNSQFVHFQDDAPACDVCGSITVRNGTCYKCFNCGNSMGCS
jgi:ribonucleoside-diphosphate reductase alpha chain